MRGVGRGRYQGVLLQHLIARAGRVQPLLDLVLVEGGTEQAPRHAIEAVAAVERVVPVARLAEVEVIGRQRRAHRPASVAGRRLDPEAIDLAGAQHTAVGHAIEGNAACQAKIAHAEALDHVLHQPLHHLLGDELDRCGDIHLPLRQELLGRSRRGAEQLVELAIGHAQAGAILEVREVEMEGAVRLDLDQVVADQRGVFRLAVGREPHHLVLAGIDLEPEIVGERRVEQAERMRKMDLAVDLDRVVLAQPRRGRRPLADAIHGQDRRASEGRWIEGAGGVRLVMLGEHQLLGDVDAGHVPRQVVAQHLALEQLLARPHGKCRRKRAKPARRQRKVGLEQALELQERLVVEDDVVDVLKRHPAGLEAVFHRLCGKGRVVADAREPLLLRRRNDFALLHQRGRAVVIEGGDAEDVHPSIPPTPRRPMRVLERLNRPPSWFSARVPVAAARSNRICRCA
jgi:hypothetical protein